MAETRKKRQGATYLERAVNKCLVHVEDKALFMHQMCVLGPQKRTLRNLYKEISTYEHSSEYGRTRVVGAFSLIGAVWFSDVHRSQLYKRDNTDLVCFFLCGFERPKKQSKPRTILDDCYAPASLSSVVT